jgi:hypothetical protein
MELCNLLTPLLMFTDSVDLRMHLARELKCKCMAFTLLQKRERWLTVRVMFYFCPSSP